MGQVRVPSAKAHFRQAVFIRINRYFILLLFVSLCNDEGDIYVADCYRKIVDGTLIRNNPGNSIYTHTGRGVITLKESASRERKSNEKRVSTVA